MILILTILDASSCLAQRHERKALLEDNPCFYLLFVFGFLSQGLLLNSIATPLYLYFSIFVVPRRVANAKLLFIFGTAWKQIAFRHHFGH